MLAAVMRNARLDVATVADPEPGPGQLLVRTRACGICGSDLHALQHGPDLVAMADEAAGLRGRATCPLPMINMDLSRDVVMGHEFVGEVLAAGAGATAHAVGDLVVSMPVAFDAAGHPPGGLLEPLPGRLRRADGAQRRPRPDRAQRALGPPRRADRADGRGGARREPLGHRARHRGRGARLRTGRARRRGRAGGEGHRADRRRRLLPHPSRPRRGPRRPPGGRPRPRPSRWPPGARPTAPTRS